MALVCNKCGRPVPRNNDATIFTSIVSRDPTFGMCVPRHLLPVVEGGQVVCEGSPSRAQYLEGQPRDTREDFPYEPGNEKLYREGYARLLEYASRRQLEADTCACGQPSVETNIHGDCACANWPGCVTD